MEELVKETPYIEIGEKGPLASLKDFHKFKDKNLSILAEDLAIDLTSCIKLAAKKAIPRFKTYEFFKL